MTADERALLDPPTSRPRVNAKITADIVVLTIRDDALHVALVERGKEPFCGCLALPGGFLRDGEDLEQTARRELREETGLDPEMLQLRQLKTYSAPERDPRPGRVISTAFLAIASNLPAARTPDGLPGNDVRRAVWTAIDSIDLSKLAFDHREILLDGRDEARRQLEDTLIATSFCGETFTIPELRTVYEIVWGTPVEPRNFHRKATTAEGFIERTSDKRKGSGRPARLYRAGPATRIYPPINRPGALTTSTSHDSLRKPGL